MIIVLQQLPHERFQRDGCDLFMTHGLTLTEALCGFVVVIKHLDGRDLVVRQHPGEVISPGKQYKSKEFLILLNLSLVKKETN